MSRDPGERYADILAAIDRCERYQARLADADPLLAGMAYDAILRNLAVIGEAVRALPSDVKLRSPTTPWPNIAGLRNIVVHEYFRVDHDLIADIVQNELEPLASAIRQLCTDEPSR
ncbi:MAG TPA: HepT-like ribonuclease domain-containing protein [Jatrophihabitantaceae bacterium]|nr:HepT-like ribonuclease domain-containing protein [Jatrophihabitantaceae bacterium]